MDNTLEQIITLATRWWGYGLAAIGLFSAGYAFGRKYVAAVSNAFRLSRHIHTIYGSDAHIKLTQDLEQYERSILVSKLRLQLLETTLQLSVYLTDEKGKCIWINQQLATLFGISLADATSRGLGWTASVIPADRTKAIRHWMAAVTEGVIYQDSYTIENQITKIQSIVDTIANPITEEGVLIGYIGTVWKRPNET